jgi:UDP-4-amino-4,6-dideoxy-N-acetyl-beta-L-altrosamine transaminase
MKTIPYGYHWINKDDQKAVCRALKSTFITQGPLIREFEDSLCKYTGAKYAVAVSSGTAALHLASFVSGIKCGDEVITSPLTFVASANCILYCRAKPVFADVESGTANIDPEEINKKITKKTKMVIPVHYAGNPCDMKEISRIARKKWMLVIEDAAHALGAVYRGSKIGSCKYSDMTIFSFHPVKHITTGEGGAVMTNNKYFYEKLLMLRNHGITKEKYTNKPDGGWYYEMQALGFNYRITDIQCALGLSQLKRLDYFVRRRRQIAGQYNSAFKGNPYFDIPSESRAAFSSYHLYPIRLRNKFINKRKEIFASLRNKGLGVQVHYIPVYLQPYYKNLGYKKGLCPQAEKFYGSEISLPIYPLMTAAQINKVIKTTIDVLKN